LGIEMIPAYSLQARGHSERRFSTWQGRLPQELRLAGISGVEEANRFLRERYMGEMNRKFSGAAAQAGHAFVPAWGQDLDHIFSVQHERAVAKDNTVRLVDRTWQIERTPWRGTLAEERKRKREELLQATEQELEAIRQQVARRKKKILRKEEIALKVGRVVNRFKMAKHFELTIEDGRFHAQRREEEIREEGLLDGVYVIRTSESKENLSAPDVVRHYKNLANVERAFRCWKGMDIRVRPIYLRTEEHVRAHIFLCLLAYYVEWHMRAALAPLLFEEEDLAQYRQQRNPVVPAEPSAAVQIKKQRKQTAEGFQVQSFPTLLQALATRCRNTCQVQAKKEAPTFEQVTQATPLQARIFQCLGL